MQSSDNFYPPSFSDVCHHGTDNRQCHFYEHAVHNFLPPVLRFICFTFSHTACLVAWIGLQFIKTHRIVENGTKLIIDCLQISRLKSLINHLTLLFAYHRCSYCIDWCISKIRKHLIFHHVFLLFHGGFPQSLLHVCLVYLPEIV